MDKILINGNTTLNGTIKVSGSKNSALPILFATLLTDEKCQISNVQFVYGNAQQMPFQDESFEGVTCAFGCRNFQNLDEGLKEMYRVLKPGGQVTILEFSYPSNPFVCACYNIYFNHVMPFIGRVVSRDKTAYNYLNKSVKSFYWGEQFLQHLRKAGFSNPHFQTLTFGIATIYMAYK